MHFAFLFIPILFCCQKEQSAITTEKIIANNVIEIEQEIKPIQNPTDFYQKLSNMT